MSNNHNLGEESSRLFNDPYRSATISSPSSTMLMAPINNSQNGSRNSSPTRPLLSNGSNRPGAPLANIETDDEIDDREVVNRPHPGVDDGFFSSEGSDNDKPKEDSENPDVELIPTGPKDPEETDIPEITPRLGPDGGDQPDSFRPPGQHPDFNTGFRPFGWDLEVGGTLPSGETIPDLNVYQHKKTLAQGMMDLALFSANANQLRYVLETFSNHPYFYPSVVLIALSLLLQIAVGVGLIWNATYNIKDQKALCIANRVNNFTTICVFFVTVINVFISAFGVAPATP